MNPFSVSEQDFYKYIEKHSLEQSETLSLFHMEGGVEFVDDNQVLKAYCSSWGEVWDYYIDGVMEGLIKKVVILNGPPGCGKDVGCEYLTNELRDYNTTHKSFKNELIDICCSIIGWERHVWDRCYDKREWKEEPHEDLIVDSKPLSPRQYLQHISEKVTKPLFGNDIFGKKLAKNLEGGVNVVSDGGFDEELLPIISQVGGSNILVLKISREGCSFEGDTRNYFSSEVMNSCGIKQVNIDNNGTEEEYFGKLKKEARSWLGL